MICFVNWKPFRTFGAALGTSHNVHLSLKTRCGIHRLTESSMLLLVGDDVSESLAVPLFKVDVLKL